MLNPSHALEDINFMLEHPEVKKELMKFSLNSCGSLEETHKLRSSDFTEDVFIKVIEKVIINEEDEEVLSILRNAISVFEDAKQLKSLN